ncbi:hypothetical protein [Conchiformibius kuhniae]|uniref:Uncharacterized protein n=1 Tax=Conchiformibius kuhniae TaxID=211502 RepID=A0ABD8B7C1_9NEIS|nr:hypothetical protein [Conchiformibius kuhniae]
MRIDDVPQDQSRTYRGHHKILYATRNGRYEAAPSNGWAAEEYATEQAVADLHAQSLAAYREAASGKRSPLYYYMYCYRHDETSLAQSAGVWRWRVRRHFRPDVFARLPESVLRRYARALNVSVAALQTLPPAPLNPFAGDAE